MVPLSLFATGRATRRNRVQSNCKHVPATTNRQTAPTTTGTPTLHRETSVLFIGTHLVTSTPQWIRRLVRPRDLCVYTRTRSGLRGLCLYVNVCSNVLGSCGLCTFGYVSPSTLTFSSPRTVDIRSSCHFSPSRPLCRFPPAPHLEPTFSPCLFY